MPIRFSSKAPFLQRVPDPLRLFGKSGSVDSIFRPRVLGNGVFAINTGYGVSFTLAGIDSEGLNRRTLDLVSQQIAIANRVLPPECQLFEYLMTAYSDDIPARPIKQEVVRRQADERSKFLKEKARFKSIRVMVTLYLPGKVAEDGDDFTQKSRSALRKLQARRAVIRTTTALDRDQTTEPRRVGTDLQLSPQPRSFAPHAEGGRTRRNSEKAGKSEYRCRWRLPQSGKEVLPSPIAG